MAMNMKETELGQGDVYLKRQITPIDYFPVPSEESVLQIDNRDHVRLILLAADLWVNHIETTQTTISFEILKEELQRGSGKLPLSQSCQTMLMSDHRLSKFTTSVINYFEANPDFSLYLVWLRENNSITPLGKVMSKKILKYELWVDSERHRGYVELRGRRRQPLADKFSISEEDLPGRARGRNL